MLRARRPHRCRRCRHRDQPELLVADILPALSPPLQSADQPREARGATSGVPGQPVRFELHGRGGHRRGHACARSRSCRRCPLRSPRSCSSLATSKRSARRAPVPPPGAQVTDSAVAANAALAAAPRRTRGLLGRTPERRELHAGPVTSATPRGRCAATGRTGGSSIE